MKSGKYARIVELADQDGKTDDQVLLETTKNRKRLAIEDVNILDNCGNTLLKSC